MPSASKSTALNPYNYTLTASFSERKLTEHNIETNTSNIDLSASLQANGAHWTSQYDSSLQLYWHDNRSNSNMYVATLTFQGLSGDYDRKELNSEIEVSHKEDGTLSGYVIAVFDKGQTTSSYAPNTGSVQTDLTALTTIPRYFTETPVIEFNSSTTTSITIDWCTSETCDSVKYYLDGGSAVSVFSGSATSGSFTISDLSPNTSHTIYVECRRKDSQLSSNSDPISVSTSNKTIKLKVNGVWKEATPYVKVNGEWKIAVPFYKVNGTWKQGI